METVTKSHSNLSLPHIIKSKLNWSQICASNLHKDLEKMKCPKEIQLLSVDLIKKILDAKDVIDKIDIWHRRQGVRPE